MNTLIKPNKDIWIALLAISASMLAPAAEAASFDCAKAGTRAERLICDNPYISALDDKLGVAYKAALKNKQQPDRIREEQRDWLREREEYITAWDMLIAYKDRLKALGVTNIYPDRKPGEKRDRYFITDESEFIENESENRPFCRAVLDALINKKVTTKSSDGCTDVEILKLPGVSNPPWQKLDFAQHEELAKKIMTLSRVGTDEYFRKQKHAPERYPTPEQQQRSLENIKQMGAELFMLRLLPEYYGDLVLVTLRITSTDCGRVSVTVDEATYNAWVTPDLKEIASRPDVVGPSEGRPLLYRGRLYLVSAGSDVDIGIPGHKTTGSVCAISRIID